METTRYPEFQQAAIEAQDEFDYGRIIPHQWLYDHFKLPQPKHGTFREIEKWHFDFMAAMDGFREMMLIEFQKSLRNVRGKGWLVVEPKDQTSVAMGDFKTAFSRHVKKAFAAITNIAAKFLDTQKQKENSDAIGKLGAIKAFSRATIEGRKNKLIS